MYIASCFFKLTSVGNQYLNNCRSIQIVHWYGCRTREKHDTQHVYGTVQITISARVVGYILVWNVISTFICTKTNGEAHLMNIVLDRNIGIGIAT